jgi:hypothetical protein
VTDNPSYLGNYVTADTYVGQAQKIHLAVAGRTSPPTPEREAVFSVRSVGYGALIGPRSLREVS